MVIKASFKEQLWLNMAVNPFSAVGQIRPCLQVAAWLQDLGAIWTLHTELLEARTGGGSRWSPVLPDSRSNLFYVRYPKATRFRWEKKTNLLEPELLGKRCKLDVTSPSGDHSVGTGWWGNAVYLSTFSTLKFLKITSREPLFNTARDLAHWLWWPFLICGCFCYTMNAVCMCIIAPKQS